MERAASTAASGVCVFPFCEIDYFMNLGNNAFALLFSRGWHYAGSHRKLFVIYMLMFVGAQAFELIEPFVIGRMLNDVQIDLAAGLKLGDKLLLDVGKYLLMLLGVSVGFWAFHGPARVIERYVAFQIRSSFKAELFRKVTALPVQWHSGHHSGQTIDKINRATTAMSNFFQDTFEIVYMVLRLLGTLVILFYFMPIAAAAALGATLLSLLIIALFDRILDKQYDELNIMDNHVASAIHDYVSNIVSVITLRLENRTLAEVLRRIYRSQSLFTVNAKVNEIKWALTSFVVMGMTVMVMFWYVQSNLLAKQVILAGTFFTLFEYLRRIGESFYTFAGYYGVVVRQAADLRGVDTIGDAYDELDHSADQAEPLSSEWRKIRVQNLNFTYEDDKHRLHHLNDVAIELVRGKSIALVGESGSGKSTLLNLLRGLQKPQAVSVVVDGTQMPHGLRHLAAVTTLMPQDPEIFADTIAFNIAFGMDADRADMIDAVEAARLASVLGRLSDGLETNIAEKGVNLSGGEKQRLALARGIFFARESSIILMDEPTSSVDTANERLIYSAVLRKFADRCLVSSIHKLHLLELFDCIYVLDNGRVVESGTFSELLAKNGQLAAMWRNYQVVSAGDGLGLSKVAVL